MIQLPKIIRNANIATLSVLASTAHAQWTVTNLNPAGSTVSYAYAASGGQQAGWARVGGINHAGLWSGTAASWVDLSPTGWGGASSVYAISGGQQVGYQDRGIYHAILWSGSAASGVDLHPAGSTDSFARAVCGGQQAGIARVSGVDHAALWNGTAASWVDLNPAAAGSSDAFAISGGQQTGSAYVGGVRRASLWTGTAASWVDLNPAGSIESYAYAAGGGQQAGSANVGGFTRASLWSGTAASWVDLSPAGATHSVAYAISGGQQAGRATVGNAHHASLWSGTAASWVDLHAFLPAGFTSSVASGISTDGTNLFVCGSGYNTLTGRNEALLWTRTLDADGDGLLDDWEDNGIPYTDANGLHHYMLPGANKFRKDIYVEVDAMAGLAPSQAAIDRVIAAFNATGHGTNPAVPAPAVQGGLPGITLHVLVDQGDLNIPRRPYPGAFAEFQQDKSGSTYGFGTDTERSDSANWPAIREAKRKAYRYCIFAQNYDAGGSSGLAETPGNDFMVTLGLWPTPGGTEAEQAGTFMHELGHTLGLHHGGDQPDPLPPGNRLRYNYKPNYFSVMNYLWQTPRPWMQSGIGPGQWEDFFPNFSERKLDDLDEALLFEANGIQGNIPFVRVPYSIPAMSVNCPGETGTACTSPPSAACMRYAMFAGSVDWDHNCNTTSPIIMPLDINNIQSSTAPSPGDTLTGFNDWASLRYDFIGTPGYADGVVVTGSPVEIDLATHLYLNSLPPPPPACIADFNRSGGTPDDADVAAFFQAWNEGDPSADMNLSGGTPDDADVAEFFTLWNNGC